MQNFEEFFFFRLIEKCHFCNPQEIEEKKTFAKNASVRKWPQKGGGQYKRGGGQYIRGRGSI